MIFWGWANVIAAVLNIAVGVTMHNGVNLLIGIVNAGVAVLCLSEA